MLSITTTSLHMYIIIQESVSVALATLCGCTGSNNSIDVVKMLGMYPMLLSWYASLSSNQTGYKSVHDNITMYS